MALYKWDSSYSVGIEHLDNQHKELVRQINVLHDAMTFGKGKEIMLEILCALIDYTATHFKSEEDLFDQYNFPNSEKHKAEHAKFVEEVLNFKREYKNGRVMISYRVIIFLKEWLLSHILGSDMAYKTFLQSNGVS